MSNPNITPLPLPDDDRDEQATVEVDGDEVLDPDIDEDLIDSASADRLASQEGASSSESTLEDQPDVLGADVPLNDEPGAGAREPDQRGE